MISDDKVIIDLSMLLPEEEFYLTGKITGKRAEYLLQIEEDREEFKRLLQKEKYKNKLEVFKNQMIRFIEDY